MSTIALALAEAILKDHERAAEITELRASLHREENARKVLAETERRQAAGLSRAQAEVARLENFLAMRDRQIRELQEQLFAKIDAEQEALDIPAFLRSKPTDLAGVYGSAGEFPPPVMVPKLPAEDAVVERIRAGKTMADRIKETEERAAQDELNERVNTENAG